MSDKRENKTHISNLTQDMKLAKMPAWLRSWLKQKVMDSHPFAEGIIEDHFSFSAYNLLSIRSCLYDRNNFQIHNNKMIFTVTTSVDINFKELLQYATAFYCDILV